MQRPDMEELMILFMSLIGAIAYALLIRLDVAVFVCALQRVTHKPQIIHIKRANAVVRYMQKNLKHLTYKHFSSPSHFAPHSSAVSELLIIVGDFEDTV